MVVLFELLSPKVLPSNEILQMSLANKVLDFLLEVDALFSIMTVVFVVVPILALIPLECTFPHLFGRSYQVLPLHGDENLFFLIASMA